MNPVREKCFIYGGMRIVTASPFLCMSQKKGRSERITPEQAEGREYPLQDYSLEHVLIDRQSNQGGMRFMSICGVRAEKGRDYCQLRAAKRTRRFCKNVFPDCIVY